MKRFYYLNPKTRARLIQFGIPLVFFLVGLALPSPFFRGNILKILNDTEMLWSDTTNMVVSGGVYNGSIITGTTTRNGYGKFETEQGDVYEGDWKDDKLPYGRKTTRYSIYNGRFNKELEFHGFGIVEYTKDYISKKKAEGYSDSLIMSKYIGNWKNNVKSGLGRSVKIDGTMDFGIYSDGRINKGEVARYRIGGCVYGIDASHHQKDINWDELAIYCDDNGNAYKGNPKSQNHMQPVFFAYIKATEGATVKDEMYNLRMIEAERHGIVKGSYHLLRLLTSTVDDQLKNFFETATWTKGDLPPALDIEFENEIVSCGEEAFYATAVKWLSEVEKKMGVKPIIYTNENIRSKYLQNERFKGYDIWISKYGDSPKNFDWQIWQLTENGHIRGNQGNIDINLYKGDYVSFMNFVNR